MNRVSAEPGSQVQGLYPAWLVYIVGLYNLFFSLQESFKGDIFVRQELSRTRQWLRYAPLRLIGDACLRIGLHIS